MKKRPQCRFWFTITKSLIYCNVMFYALPTDLDGANGSESNDVERALAEKRDKLTFVSHAGEEKHFVRDLLKRIDKTNVAAFFDDDMSVCSSAGNEMVTRAAEADQAVVVLSRSFLTKKWAMDELSIFIKKQVKMYPLYYGITPDELKSIVALYDRQGDSEYTNQH